MLNFRVITPHSMVTCQEENEALLVGRARLSDAADDRWLQARTHIFRVDKALDLHVQLERGVKSHRVQTPPTADHN